MVVTYNSGVLTSDIDLSDRKVSSAIQHALGVLSVRVNALAVTSENISSMFCIRIRIGTFLTLYLSTTFAG